MHDWITGVFHDGSEVYVSNLYPTLGESVEIRLRVPLHAAIDECLLRTSNDGERWDIPMTQSHKDTTHRWYQAQMPMRSNVMPYRFILRNQEGTWYYTGIGGSRIESPDFYNFRLLADYHSPSWLPDTVFYQIFPERFCNGDPSLNPEDGQRFTHPSGRVFTTRLLDWDDAPLNWHDGGNLDFFGGDLPGIESQIPYLQELGVNALYLNPIFLSKSNHKYNIADFYQVDPHLGGNEALASLSTALHETGMRLILDITPNHCGADHEWFQAAQADPDAPSAEYFIFYEHPNTYESWLGHPTLPKLNYKSQALRDVMYRAEDSVFQHWLKAPYNIDGWRLDVWNMTARQADFDANEAVAQEIKSTVKSVNPEAYIFGETFFDGTPNLQGDQLDGVMNYRGFSHPVWEWLGGYNFFNPKQEQPPRIPAEVAAQQMQEYLAAIPWVIARQQFNLLGSHDTPRILSVVHNDKELAKLAAMLLLTFPGVPSVYYGEEIGMTGWNHTGDNRHPMPWHEEKWDQDLREHYRQLIALRRHSHALIHGGYQVLYAQEDSFVFQRQSKQERLLIVAYRGADTEQTLAIPVADGGIANGKEFEAVFGEARYRVHDGHIQLQLDPYSQGFILRELA